jgi:poly(A) polymerase
VTDAALPGGLADVIRRARPLADRFLDSGHRIYLVGGVVRDHLLERTRPEQDFDLTTDARPGRIKALVGDLAEAVWTQGERFGTIGCTIDGRPYEITTHRAEVYDDASRKPVVAFGDHIEDDLARRDFTVNAIAVDLDTMELVDPHHGRADLLAGVLRTPLDPQVSFSEDPLRMLRAARFHAGYALVPVPELIDAIVSMTDRMEIVSTERIRDELQKLILLDDPGSGLALLATTGLLRRVLPKLGGLDGASAAASGERLMALPADAAMRWAALFCRYGMTPSDLRALKFSGALARDVIWFASAGEWIDAPGSRGCDAPALRRAAALAPTGRDLTELYDWVGGLREAAGLTTDDVDSHRRALAELLAVEPDLGDPPALLTGEAVCAALGIEPGPEVGVAMRWLRDLRVEEGPVSAEEAATRLAAWWPERERGSESRHDAGP